VVIYRGDLDEWWFSIRGEVYMSGCFLFAGGGVEICSGF